MRTGIWLVALLCAPGMVWGQPLPVAEGPVTAGIVEGQRIQARQMQDSLSTLVDAVNELHRRTQELEGQLADQAELQRQVEELASRWIDTPEVHTIGAGGGFPNLNAAFDYLADKRLARGAEVRFEVRAGEHMHAEPVVIDHPDAARVFIEGVGRERSILRFNQSDGIVVRNGRLGGMTDLAVRGPGVDAGPFKGLQVDRGHFIGANLEVAGFGAACVTGFGHSMIEIDDLGVDGCADGIRLEVNSRAELDVVEIANFQGYGLYLDSGSSAFLRGGGSILPRNRNVGVGLWAVNGSNLTVEATAQRRLVMRDLHTGIGANAHSYIALSEVDAQAGHLGLELTNNSTILVGSSTIQGDNYSYSLNRGSVLTRNPDGVVRGGPPIGAEDDVTITCPEASACARRP